MRCAASAAACNTLYLMCLGHELQQNLIADWDAWFGHDVFGHHVLVRCACSTCLSCFCVSRATTTRLMNTGLRIRDACPLQSWRTFQFHLRVLCFSHGIWMWFLFQEHFIHSCFVYQPQQLRGLPPRVHALFLHIFTCTQEPMLCVGAVAPQAPK